MRCSPADLPPLGQAVRQARRGDDPTDRRARERARFHGPENASARARDDAAQGGRGKTLETAAARRAAVKYAVTHAGVSERRACELVGMTRSVFRYRPDGRKRETQDTEA